MKTDRKSFLDYAILELQKYAILAVTRHIKKAILKRDHYRCCITGEKENIHILSMVNEKSSIVANENLPVLFNLN